MPQVAETTKQAPTSYLEVNDLLIGLDSFCPFSLVAALPRLLRLQEAPQDTTARASDLDPLSEIPQPFSVES